jgi:hypothetical protein
MRCQTHKPHYTDRKLSGVARFSGVLGKTTDFCPLPEKRMLWKQKKKKSQIDSQTAKQIFFNLF